MPTETRCTSAVATVMPISTGTGLKRVAKVSAISCDLSPSSATKMTAKLSASAARKPFTKELPGYRDREEGAGRPRPGRQGTTAKSKVSLASDEAARPDHEKTRDQHVDRDVGSYSPSRHQAYPAGPAARRVGGDTHPRAM